MKMQIILTIESGPNISSDEILEKVASCVGFAHSMQLPIQMIPDSSNGKEPSMVGWGNGHVDKRDTSLFTKARKLLPDGQPAMPRKEFVRALAAAVEGDPRQVGVAVKRWIRTGVMVES